MKRKILLTILVLASVFFANNISAQIYCSEACFYENIKSDGHGKQIHIAVFNGTKKNLLYYCACYESNARDNLAKNINYYEEKMGPYPKTYTYCPSKSTSTKEVYVTGGSPFYEYLAFSKDLSTCIYWQEQNPNYSSTVHTTESIRRPKEDFLPKSINYDFLND